MIAMFKINNCICLQLLLVDKKVQNVCVCVYGGWCSALTLTCLRTHNNTHLNFVPLNVQGPDTEIHSNGVLLFLREKP